MIIDIRKKPTDLQRFSLLLNHVFALIKYIIPVYTNKNPHKK